MANPNGNPLGRPKGSKNKIPMNYREAVRRAGITPLQFLLNVMADEKAEFRDRVDAAKACAPYCHPRLNTIQLEVEGTVDLRQIDRTVVPALEVVNG